MKRLPLLALTSLFVALIQCASAQAQVCRIDSSLSREGWTSDQMGWSTVTQHYAEYDAEGRLTGITYQLASEEQRSNAAWQAFRRKYMYGEDGALQRVQHERRASSNSPWEMYREERHEQQTEGWRQCQTWMAAGSHMRSQQAWQKTAFERIQHDDQGRLTEEAHYLVATPGGIPTPTYRTTFTYQQDQCVASTSWQGDEQQDWLPQTRQQYHFDALQRLLRETMWHWHPPSRTWQSQRKTLYRYGDADNWQEQWVLTWLHNHWDTVSLCMRQYDVMGRIEQVDWYQWDEFQRKTWCRRRAYEYEDSRWSQQQWTVETIYTADKWGRISPYRKLHREYLAPQQLAKVTQWRWQMDRQDWQPTHQSQRLFEDEEPSSQYEGWAQYMWNMSQHVWEPLSLSETWYQCEADAAVWHPVVFPSPVMQQLSLDTFDWSAGISTVELLDAAGKQALFYQGNFAQQPLEVDVSNLAKGVYQLKVQTGQRVGYSKIWVK